MGVDPSMLHAIERRPTRSLGRRALWLIERMDGRDVRRTLILTATGEVLDAVWLEAGAVRSYSAPRATRPARRHAPLPREGG